MLAARRGQPHPRRVCSPGPKFGLKRLEMSERKRGPRTSVRRWVFPFERLGQLDATRKAAQQRTHSETLARFPMHPVQIECAKLID